MAEGLQPTSGSTNVVGPRADLVQSDFDNLIFQKGRPVLFEKALQCPCKSPSTNQQSNCKNCGGGGWIFINPVETRMVVQGVAIVNDIKGWSEESRGTINISCKSSEQLTYMDRVSLIDTHAIYNEVVFLKSAISDPTKYFSYVSYKVKEILYVGIFKSVDEPIIRLNSSDFILQNNIVKINKSIINALGIQDAELSITIKYIHPPTYHILELKREAMESFILTGGGERQQRFPISAVGKRTHYMLDSENLTKNGILDNNYTESKNCQL